MKPNARHGELAEIFFLRIVTDGQTVEGTVTGSEFDITVSIISPYRNLSKGLHIPYFARSQRSFNGLYGHVRATELLSDLYNVGTRLKLNLVALQAEWHQLSRQVTDLSKFNPKDLDIQVIEIEDHFFEQGFGEVISLSLRKSLIPILEGNAEFG